MTQRERNWLLVAPAAAWFSSCWCSRSPSSSSSASASGGRPAATCRPSRFEQYANLPARLTAFKNTLTLAPLGTLAALLIAYPLAYQLAVRTDPKWRTLLLVLVIVPFWTSILIRSYAWIFILGGAGLPALLEAMGIEACG
jgi:spermidine/putrescine transport system permease protein